MNTRRKLLLFGKRGGAFDPDAAAYIARVETADGQSLETGVKTAINDFVVGVKADGDWSALKASCILAGARTLNGALEPLAGVAPTSFNFVGTDYNRKTGLKGDGTSKYIDTNHANDSTPQNNNHTFVWVTEPATTAGHFISSGSAANAGNTGIFRIPDTNNVGFVSRSTGIKSDFSIVTDALLETGAYATSRSIAENFISRVGGVNRTNGIPSTPPIENTLLLFARNDPSLNATVFSNPRMAVYSAGESINLEKLDARVSVLLTAIDGAIL